MADFTDYITIPFIKNNIKLDNAPVCGMTVRSAGSMRFRWNEDNPIRKSVLNQLSVLYRGKVFVPVQLEHTHIVYDINSSSDSFGKIGDGLITTNKNLIPTITVADCVPIYLYDSVSGVFGIVHSGWKGTGIAVDAINLAVQNYGSKIEDFCVSIGPHIHDCCYIVNEERAKYFSDTFTPECVRELEEGTKVDWNNGGGKLYRLSLEKANLASLIQAGVPKENIYIHPDCTCCSKDGFYGSNRRETKLNGLPDKFTVQAAFITF